MSKERTALVLGASGGAGGAVASKLREAGWTVKALRRVQDQHSMIHEGTTWVRGDAMNAADVARAARGVSVIVHAVNPPGYKRWDELVLPMIDNTIAAAVAEKATIVLPGTVYNFGADALPLVAEDALQRPSTRKGAIRVELERRIEAATRQDARALIVRAGDFFGPNSTSNWFAQGIVKAGSPVRKVSLLGDAGVGHQWAYLPDFALTVAKLLARRDTLEPFARFHFGGHWDADGTR
ncbi:MAG: hypothetical protein JWP57_4547, partial [Spirosoma sp.]|nr:hypothetical protein [Spirosoma sp.]